MQSGELAALGTAICWTLSSLAFELSARRIGSLSLNLVRVVLAFVWLTGLALIVRGVPLPTDASAAQWGWLSLSGFVGMVLGDLCTFRAYVEFGARRTMVVATSVPVFTAALAWIILGERPTLLEVGGMAVIVAGVLLAVLERQSSAVIERRNMVRGVLLGLGGALGQAGGLLLSKRGMAGYNAVSSTQIRVLAAIAGFAVVLTAAGWWRKLVESLRDRPAMNAAAVGAMLGPGFGITLSLYAMAHAKAGIAACLMSLSPIFIIPFAAARGERVGLGGVLAAALAVAGVVIIALS
jgi:drug/metabolite transporter (DMT)-like permease